VCFCCAVRVSDGVGTGGSGVDGEMEHG
jgi:hypothetical protein